MIMGLREANQQFGKIVRAIRQGETVVLTDRGKPFAEIKSFTDPLEARMAAMVAEGRLIRATKPGKMDLTGWKPLELRGGRTTSQLISEDREDRL